jgi:hypothetical protein
MRTDVFRSLTNSAQFAGIFADSNVGRAVSAAGRGRDSVDFASRSLGSPNPFLAPRPKLHVKIRDDRLGSNRQTEHRVLTRPLGRSITQASDADAARQSSLDGCLHEFGREERERDRQIDLSNAAFVPRGDLFDTGDGAGDDLIKPTSATRACAVVDGLRPLRSSRNGEAVTFASAPSVASAGVCLLHPSKHGLIASRPIAMGSTDETDAADAIFSPRAHPNHPATGATFTREGNFDPETAEEGLRPS